MNGSKCAFCKRDMSADERVELAQLRRTNPVHLLGHLVHWSIESRERFRAAEQTRGRGGDVGDDERGVLLCAMFDVPRGAWQAASNMIREALARPIPPYVTALEEVARTAHHAEERARHAEVAVGRLRDLLEEALPYVEGDAKLVFGEAGRALGRQVRRVLDTEDVGVATMDRLHHLERAADERRLDVAARLLQEAEEIP